MKDGQQSMTEDLPVWESVWRFDKNTVFSYGPWADAQRVLLYDFFFPPEYRNSEVTYAYHYLYYFSIMDISIILYPENSRIQSFFVMPLHI